MEKQHKEYVYQIIEHCNKNRTTILLSATIPESLQEFSAVGMREYQLIRLSSEYQLSDQTYMHLFEISSEQKVSLLIYLL
jgi:superfamily II DNA/RNA helicase